MFLSRQLLIGDDSFDMVGAFGFDVQMMEERQAHGYEIACVNASHPWLAEGTKIVGHEHHHSRVLGMREDQPFAFDITRGKGTFGKQDGVCRNRTVAGYLHVNAIASPQWALGFVDAAVEYRSQRLNRERKTGER